MSQSELPAFGGGVPDRPPDGFDFVRDADQLRRFSLDPRWFGQRPGEVDDELVRDQGIWRVHVMAHYAYSRSVDQSLYGGIQFRAQIHTLGRPTEAWALHFRTVTVHKIATLFDTGVYEGYMSGFDPFLPENVALTSTEGPERVGATEGWYLGVPEWYCEVYDEDRNLRGHAGGFFDPFIETEVGRRPPQQERWLLTRNEARRTYEIRPQGRARARLEGVEKEVYVNGKYIGQLSPSRGTAEIKFEYRTKDGTWKNSRTGRQMWSRQKLISEGLATPAAIAARKPIWKVAENEEAIFLVTTKPDDFEPVTEADIDIEAIGVEYELALAGAGEPTLFDIRWDEKNHQNKPVLGLYDAPTTRTIRELTRWDR